MRLIERQQGQMWQLSEPLALIQQGNECKFSHECRPRELRPGTIAVFLPGGRLGDESYLITLAALPVMVNGLPVRGGLQALHARDEIGLASLTLTVSSTDEARSEIWDGILSNSPARCPVCRAHLDAGMPVIRCSRCQTPHHTSCLQARAFRCGVFGCLSEIKLKAQPISD